MIQLPEEFEWVDQSNTQFSNALELCLKSDKNLFIQAKAGTGKSLIIKILSKMLSNVIVLAPTGRAAVELSTESIAAKTIHSFLSIPPTPIFTYDDLFSCGTKNLRLLQKAECIIIDEVSMISNNLFDFMCEKIVKFRADKEVPRMILFGDVMQLPPVIDTKNQVVSSFFKEKYNGNVMFFNSDWFSDLKFKTIFLRKSYRQSDQEFADKLMQIGYRDHTQETLDYFNQRVMSLPKFEKDHLQYIYMTPTNRVVDTVNNKYMQTLTGKLQTYKADMSRNFPIDKKPNNDFVDIREGAQVMCLVNNYEQGYVNGTIGIVEEVNKDNLIISHNGSRKIINKTRFSLWDIELDSNGNISKKEIGWYRQIDCKIARAISIHKSQGASLDSAYLCLQNWTPDGLVYVALSRLRSLDGLAINRPLVDSDIKVSQEAYDFLEG